MDASRRIFVLTDKLLEAPGERGLLLRAIGSLERAANPLLGSGLVIIVPRLIAAPVRNLTPGEIVGQVMLARDALGEWPRGKKQAALG